MAYFDDLDWSQGAWFYFQIRQVSDFGFRQQLVEQILNFYTERSKDVIGIKDGKIKKRIPMQRM